MHGLACKMTSRTPHPLKHGEALAHAPFQRPAFSLAEIMIAIGILGVGMLMVAATFPVGLDQCRIVSEQSVAPLVANDAFERLRLLLAEPDSAKRIWDPVNSKWIYSFKEALATVATLSSSHPPPQTVRAALPNSVPLSVNESEWRGLNELLIAPYVVSTTSNAFGYYSPVGSAPPGIEYRGAGTRFYPPVPGMVQSTVPPFRWLLPLRTNADGQPILVDPPYTWSALYRLYTNAGQTYVQFFVFVNRRGTTWPKDWPRTAKVAGEHSWTPADPVLPGPLLDAYNDKIPMSKFSEGAFLVSSQGNILRIKEVNRRDNTITLDRAPDDSIFWFIEADPATGQSPCIGVYSRTFPL